MNSGYFAAYTRMLSWCYLNSGMRNYFDSFLRKICKDYAFIEYVRDLNKLGRKPRKYMNGFTYWDMYFREVIGNRLKNLTWILGI